MYLCVMGIEFVSFNDVYIECLEMFRQCGILFFILL